MIKATSLVMTCSACPSQWQGKLEDGRMFYARYRHGYFYISVSDGPTERGFDAVTDNYLMEAEVGADMDGVMSTDEMRELTKDYVDWSLTRSFFA